MTHFESSKKLAIKNALVAIDQGCSFFASRLTVQLSVCLSHSHSCRSPSYSVASLSHPNTSQTGTPSDRTRTSDPGFRASSCPCARSLLDTPTTIRTNATRDLPRTVLEYFMFNLAHTRGRAGQCSNHLMHEHLDEFVRCYNPENRHER